MAEAPTRAASSPVRVVFAGLTCDLSGRVLLRDGVEVKLRPQTFDVLAVLLRGANQLVEKEALFRSVWRGVRVTDDSLVQCIHELREALGDAAQRLIRTVPRRGYVLAAEVREVRPVAPEAGPGAEALAAPRRLWAAAGAALLVAAGGAVVAWRVLGPRPEPPGSLAVLPFRTLAPSSEEEAVLGLGIADALILRLSAVTRLAVRPTSAVLRLRGPEVDALEAGRRLRVDYVLEGHLQRAGPTVRVTAQLLAVATGRSVWSDHLEVVASDLFRVQDAIAERAAASLLEQLSREERRMLARRATAVPEAELAYQRGRYLWSRRTESALRASVAQFERALQLDPRYALAGAGLADAHNLLGAYGATLPRLSFDRALEAARRALQLDGGMAEAHASLAFALAHRDHDWAGAEREYRRALELAPGYATAMQWLGLCFAAQGRFEEAIATSRQAVAADPMSPIIATDLGRHLYYARRYPEAVAQLKAAVDLDPTFARAHQELGRAYRQRRLVDLAVAELSHAAALSDRASSALAELAAARADAGDRTGAREIGDELARRAAAGTYVSGFHFAVIAAALGDRERAVRELRRAYEDRFNWVVFAAVEPEFDLLRGEAGFQEIVERMGLSDPAGR